MNNFFFNSGLGRFMVEVSGSQKIRHIHTHPVGPSSHT